MTRLDINLNGQYLKFKSHLDFYLKEKKRLFNCPACRIFRENFWLSRISSFFWQVEVSSKLEQKLVEFWNSTNLQVYLGLWTLEGRGCLCKFCCGKFYHCNRCWHLFFLDASWFVWMSHSCWDFLHLIGTIHRAWERPVLPPSLLIQLKNHGHFAKVFLAMYSNRLPNYKKIGQEEFKL